MHVQSLDELRHDHDFNIDSKRGERKTARVVLLTAVMMVVEILAGLFYGSMALLADGWHMGTHVAALGISLFAYRYARRHANDPSFSFGTGKVSSLGGFASAVALVMVALLMAVESTERLISPQAIRFDEAILVAVVGLAVNLLSAWILHGGSAAHEHSHSHRESNHGHHHHHHDHNLRAAYMHVLADALTSLLAILALVTGKYFGWIWMDAVMGIVGAAVITRWGYGLLRDTSGVLLDSSIDGEILETIKDAIESDSDNRVSDLHVWRVGPHHLAAIVCLVTHHPRDPAYYKGRLTRVGNLVHVTVEINGCVDERCAPGAATSG